MVTDAGDTVAEAEDALAEAGDTLAEAGDVVVGFPGLGVLLASLESSTDVDDDPAAVTE